MFEILPHFHILQIQLSEFFFIFLYELCDLIEFPEGKKKKRMISYSIKIMPVELGLVSQHKEFEPVSLSFCDEQHPKFTIFTVFSLGKWCSIRKRSTTQAIPNIFSEIFIFFLDRIDNSHLSPVIPWGWAGQYCSWIWDQHPGKAILKKHNLCINDSWENQGKIPKSMPLTIRVANFKIISQFSFCTVNMKKYLKSIRKIRHFLIVIENLTQNQIKQMWICFNLFLCI